MYSFFLQIWNYFSTNHKHDKSTQVCENDFIHLNISNNTSIPFENTNIDYDKYRHEPEPEYGFQCVYSTIKEEHNEEDS